MGQEKRLLSARSSFSDLSSEGEVLDSAPASRRKPRRTRLSYVLRYLQRKGLFVSVLAIITIFFAFGLSTSTHLHLQLHSHAASDPSRQFNNAHSSEDGLWPASLGVGGTTDLCDICDCETQPGFYAPKPLASRYEPRPPEKAVFLSKDEVKRDAYMRRAILDIYCGRQHMSTSQTTRLVRRTASHLEQMISWNITGLDFDRPTIYLTTNTSPNGKAGELRPQFFRRHARTVLDWQTAKPHAGNETNPQILWIIVEDELDIDAKVIESVRRIGVPYVYFAYGPTNGLGHAQRNAALQLIYTLTKSRQRGGLFGDGPVYCLDDDNKIVTGLLDLLKKVGHIGVFPVGNFGVKGGYEKPIISPIGEVMGSNSPWKNRTYPFDNAGFAFNSSLLGTKISGPEFWKWNKYGGESEFIGQVVSDVRQLEPLCSRDPKQDCHFAWHNEPLVPLEAFTDAAEQEYIERFGYETFRARLDDQLGARARMRGY